MDTEKPYKEGFLLFPPQGVLGQLKKSWHKKYCQLFKSSKHGIERLEVFDSEDDVTKNSSVRIITLENCIKITQDLQKPHPNAFIIVAKTFTHHFASLTESEMLEWITAFQSIAFKDDCSKQTIEEHNDLYDSSGEGVFTVRLVPSEASKRCGLEPGPYTLVITSAAIQLRNCVDHSLLCTWPYRYIRRYGYREGKFLFEAGRKCDTGEGTFTLQHSNQQEIFRCLSSKLKSMRKLLSGEVPASPVIMCGDNQFQAALSMEARSRSPLPPSPTSATPLELDFSAMSQPSTKLLTSLLIDNKPFVINNFSNTIKPNCKPKPPRKIAPSQEKNTPDSDDSATDSFGSGILNHPKAFDMSPTSSVLVTPVAVNSDYDRVEFRKDAWRTLGVDEVNHTENQCSDDENDKSGPHTSATPISQTGAEIPTPRCSKILATQVSGKSDGTEEYDKLQHFRPPAKAPSDGYTHIPMVPVNSQLQGTPTSEESNTNFNDYEVVEKMQVCRLADDSHYGYGIIRKKSLPFEVSESGPKHQVYNEQEYALVQKPKKV